MIKTSICIDAMEIAFDGKTEWSFGNDSARNVIIFRVDNRLTILKTIFSY